MATGRPISAKREAADLVVRDEERARQRAEHHVVRPGPCEPLAPGGQRRHALVERPDAGDEGGVDRVVREARDGAGADELRPLSGPREASGRGGDRAAQAERAEVEGGLEHAARRGPRGPARRAPRPRPGRPARSRTRARATGSRRARRARGRTGRGPRGRARRRRRRGRAAAPARSSPRPCPRAPRPRRRHRSRARRRRAGSAARRPPARARPGGLVGPVGVGCRRRPPAPAAPRRSAAEQLEGRLGRWRGIAQVERRARLGRQRRAHPVAAGGLRLVHRAIGGLEKLLHRVAVLGEAGDSRRDGRASPRVEAILAEAHRGHSLADRLRASGAPPRATRRAAAGRTPRRRSEPRWRSARRCDASASATPRITRSPTRWPKRLLISRRWSRSTTTTASLPPCLRASCEPRLHLLAEVREVVEARLRVGARAVLELGHEQGAVDERDGPEREQGHGRPGVPEHGQTGAGGRQRKIEWKSVGELVEGAPQRGAAGEARDEDEQQVVQEREDHRGARERRHRGRLGRPAASNTSAADTIACAEPRDQVVADVEGDLEPGEALGRPAGHEAAHGEHARRPRAEAAPRPRRRTRSSAGASSGPGRRPRRGSPRRRARPRRAAAARPRSRRESRPWPRSRRRRRRRPSRR